MIKPFFTGNNLLRKGFPTILSDVHIALKCNSEALNLRFSESDCHVPVSVMQMQSSALSSEHISVDSDGSTDHAEMMQDAEILVTITIPFCFGEKNISNIRSGQRIQHLAVS